MAHAQRVAISQRMLSRSAVSRRTSSALFAVASLALPVRALACPDCSLTRTVRASVFDGTFGTHLLLIALPLLVLTAICVLLYRIDLRSAPPERPRVFRSQEDLRS